MSTEPCEPPSPNGGYRFMLGKAIVDVGWEDGEPYTLVADGNRMLINEDDHDQPNLLAAFGYLHEFLARVTPLRADVAIPPSTPLTEELR